MSLVKRSVLLVGLLLVVAGAVWVWGNRQFLYDWQTVQSYTPSAEIAAIPSRAGMSDRGKFLFYATEPVVSEATEFNQQCTRREATAAILGCYDGVNIYIYRVDNPELSGIKEVTAAHEMLHAVWSRMSTKEKTHLERHLEQVYERVKTDALEERMAYYERQQPGERFNELHSILATEFTELDEELERHYTQYFVDRQAVVRLHTSYETVFTALKKQSESLRQEAEAMLAALNADIAVYNAAVTKLEAEITAHNNRANAIDNTSYAEVNAYNAAQGALMSRRAQLEQEERSLDRRQGEYQEKIRQYNSLVIRSETLTNSMDSLKSSSDTAE